MERGSSEPWVDLAANEPGRGVRAEAAAAKRAHPFLTALGLLLGVQTKAAAWAKGGGGEILVGKQLAKLGPSGGSSTPSRWVRREPTSTTW